MYKIITCHQCKNKLLKGDQHRKIGDIYLCSVNCNAEYLGIGASLDKLIEIHKQEVSYGRNA